MSPTACGIRRRHAAGNRQSHSESTGALRAGPHHHFPRPISANPGRAIGWQPHRAECWFIGNELNYSRNFLEMGPPLVKPDLILGGYPNPNIRIPIAPV